jgi:chlorite dismutase
MSEEKQEIQERQPETRKFVSFLFYKADPAWRRLPEQERKKGKEEFQEVVEQFKDKVSTTSYTLVGLRPDTDILLWRVTDDMDNFQEMSTALSATGLGKWLTTPYSFLAMTRKSMYVDKHKHPGQEGTRLTVEPGKAKYLFIYPFVKTSEWYALTKPARQGMMTEHIESGHKYPSVKLNTTYSYGLDDQEFVVAFETDYPGDFQDLVMDLRHAQTSRYTKRDTPIFSCIKKELKDVLDSLGG